MSPTSNTPPPNLEAHWLQAIALPGVCADLESIYEECAAHITRRSPACWASGRCCNFEKTGHRLYVTGLEVAYAISRLPQARPDDPSLRPLSLQQARQIGSCPFLISNACSIHLIKPLGCRIYFCDKSAQQWQQDLSEALLSSIRSLHDRHAIDYRYGEWRSMLEHFVAAK